MKPMIRNKKYKYWTIAGNLSWISDKVDERETWVRNSEDETLEQEMLRTRPQDWEFSEVPDKVDPLNSN